MTDFVVTQTVKEYKEHEEKSSKEATRGCLLMSLFSVAWCVVIYNLFLHS